MRFFSLQQYWRQTLVMAALVSLTGPAAYGATDADLSHLSLQQAMEVAYEHNHDLRLSAYALASARAGATIAAAAPNPTLSLQTVNINPHAGVGAGGLRSKTVDSTIGVSQLIERGGKRDLRKANAAHIEEAASSDLLDTRRQLRMAVSQAYYDVLATSEKLEISGQTASLYDKTLEAATKRLKAGDLARADLARLQVDALRSRNDAIQAEADLNAARQTLALLMGLSGDGAQYTRIALSDGWPSMAFNSPDVPSQAIEQRPDVMAARARVAAAGLSRKLALSQRTRDVTVGMQFEHYPNSDTNPQGGGNSFGISLQIPLFVRYQFDGEVRSAEVNVDVAEESLQKTVAQARADLSKSWADARFAYRRVQSYDRDLLAAARQASDAAEFAFAHGAIGVMDILDARRTYRAIQIEAISARSDYAKSMAAWQAAAMQGESQ